MAVELPGVPDTVTAALQSLSDALAAALGADLAGVVLYGGVARGRYREGRSDVNVVVLLRRAEAQVLDRAGPPLRAARRAIGVDAMLLTPAEVPAAAFDFPTKFLDIKEHHVVLAGEDPFVSLEVPRPVVQRRIAQGLRNLLLRLRRRYAAVYDDEAGQRDALRDAARPLAIELAALLRDGGHPVPEIDRTAAIFAAAAAAFALDSTTLADLAALRDETYAANDRLATLCGRVLDLLAALAEQTDALARSAA